ncbi:MAG TPA: hypothetical protein VFZ53_15490 [Polyangiaceae bacterium]
MIRSLVALGCLVAALSLSGRAQADVSGWANASAGPTYVDDGTDTMTQGALSLQAGVGSTPSNFLVGGGLFHVETHFQRGTDLGLLARLATQGYVLGRWGAALDLGGYERFWGVGSAGGLGALVLGAPWGITLRGEAALGTNDARSFGLVLGVDFARLTVFRSSGTDWFPNPFPGYREAKR